MKNILLDRFLRYVKIDTQSKDDSTTYPSTKKQFDLLNLLLDELKEMGLKEPVKMYNWLKENYKIVEDKKVLGDFELGVVKSD